MVCCQTSIFISCTHFTKKTTGGVKGGDGKERQKDKKCYTGISYLLYQQQLICTDNKDLQNEK